MLSGIERLNLEKKLIKADLHDKIDHIDETLDYWENLENLHNQFGHFDEEYHTGSEFEMLPETERKNLKGQITSLNRENHKLKDKIHDLNTKIIKDNMVSSVYDPYVPIKPEIDSGEEIINYPSGTELVIESGEEKHDYFKELCELFPYQDNKKDISSHVNWLKEHIIKTKVIQIQKEKGSYKTRLRSKRGFLGKIFDKEFFG